MKANQVKLGSILSYFQMAISIIVELAFTPIMISILGKSEYGLYNTVASTIAMLSILSLGFNASYVRYYAKYKVNEQEQEISKLNGLFILLFSAIGIVALICGLFLTNNLELVFKDGLSTDEYSLADKLMILLTINLSVSFPMGVFGNIISAHERFVYLKIVNMLRTVLGPLVSIPLLLMGIGSVGIVTSTLVVSIVADSANLYYTLFVLKEKFVFRDFEKGLIGNLFSYTAFIAINIVVDQINSNIDNLIIARFRGTSEVALYAVGQRLYTAYVRFSSAVSSVFTPRVHTMVNPYAEDKTALKDNLTSLFIKVGRIQFLILGLVASGLIFFGKPFIGKWVGEGFEASYYISILLCIPATIPLIQNLGIEIQRAENKHQFRSIAYIVMATINLVITYFLCQKYGAVGATVGTAISLIVANGLIMNTYYHKRCYIDIITYWKRIIPMLKGLVAPCLVGIALNCCADLNKTSILFISIGLFILVYSASVWCFSMNKYEKNLIKEPFMRIKKER